MNGKHYQQANGLGLTTYAATIPEIYLWINGIANLSGT
jgi:hypothetical protein